MNDEDLIPQGHYCYELLSVESEGAMKIKPCHYWSRRKDKPEQENGFCGYMDKGDWEIDGISLLWDQAKECGIKQEGIE